jgi:squalene monooxygenase
VLFYQIGNKGEETRMLVDVKGKLPSAADGSLKVSLPSSIELMLELHY